MYSMLYTVNLGLCNYVPFSQIRSQIVLTATKSLSADFDLSQQKAKLTNIRDVMMLHYHALCYVN